VLGTCPHADGEVQTGLCGRHASNGAAQDGAAALAGGPTGLILKLPEEKRGFKAEPVLRQNPAVQRLGQIPEGGVV